jgi:hypothetical protein
LGVSTKNFEAIAGYCREFLGRKSLFRDGIGKTFL